MWSEPECGVSLSVFLVTVWFLPCLQVSTREKDYIVDTIELREHMHILLDPFTNPSIVKVASAVMVTI